MKNHLNAAMLAAIVALSLAISTQNRSIAAEKPQVPKGINDGTRRGLTGTESPLVQHNFLIVQQSTSTPQRVHSDRSIIHLAE